MEELTNKNAVLNIISNEDMLFDTLTKDSPDDINFWYLHGELSEKFNYDKAEFYGDFPEIFLRQIPIGPDESLKGVVKLDGIYPVYVHGVQEKCRGYFWTAPKGIHKTSSGTSYPVWVQRGLVVLEDDTEAVEYAEEIYTKKPEVI